MSKMTGKILCTVIMVLVTAAALSAQDFMKGNPGQLNPGGPSGFAAPYRITDPVIAQTNEAYQIFTERVLLDAREKSIGL